MWAFILSRKVPTLKTCIQPKLAQCQSSSAKEKAVIFKNIMEWVCTPQGKQGEHETLSLPARKDSNYTVLLVPLSATMNLEKSSCKNDPFFDVKFNALILGCVFTFQTDLQTEVEAKSRPLKSEEICP
ncbi:hypothetical protein ElyMa_002689100 [Elysia marginata]|uniref:Uncharacterized protein n=1 Tax=Elysia marginata TaxID=1093978 RepID=A0AAV4HC22_9GAST|nr:hypothetical protein ElyMa_002689100 [Elysia marginata]